MAQRFVLPNSASSLMDTERVVLERLQGERSCTVDELLDELPGLSWSQIFLALDMLSRRGAVELRREGFHYTARTGRLPHNATEGLPWSDAS